MEQNPAIRHELYNIQTTEAIRIGISIGSLVGFKLYGTNPGVFIILAVGYGRTLGFVIGTVLGTVLESVFGPEVNQGYKITVKEGQIQDLESTSMQDYIKEFLPIDSAALL